jgi:hypothetical protein
MFTLRELTTMYPNDTPYVIAVCHTGKPTSTLTLPHARTPFLPCDLRLAGSIALSLHMQVQPR